jgi:hypothetical protein
MIRFPSKAVWAVLLLFSAGCARNDTGGASAELEKKFQESMSGVTLVGNSTHLNKPGISEEERYAIEKVSKVAGDVWLFQAHVKYAGHDLTLPLPLTVKWAGDTPVITLTDLAIPGMGTYTARVLIYRDQYAGTWSGKTAGGQLFGKVVRER